MNLKEYIEKPLEIQNELLHYLSDINDLVIFDVGACEGEETIKYSRLFPNSKIYSFEPIPGNYKKAVQNLSEYNTTNASLYEIALSNSTGEADIFVSEGHPDYLQKTSEWDYGNKSSSLLPAQELTNYYKWLNLSNTIKIKTLTLHDFCTINEIKKIDFMHMDVQGAELMVLEGAKDFLDKIKMIWLEVEMVELYKGQPLKNSVVQFLNNNNFEIIKDTCTTVSGDILCIKKDK
jgi:FkbM family methyltransferase